MKFLISSIKGSGAELFVRWLADHLGGCTVDLDAKLTPDGRIVSKNKSVKHLPGPDAELHEITLIQDAPPLPESIIVLNDFWTTMSTRDPMTVNPEVIAAWKVLNREMEVRVFRPGSQSCVQMSYFLAKPEEREGLANILGLPPRDETDTLQLDLNHKRYVFNTTPGEALQWMSDSEAGRHPQSFDYEAQKHYWQGDFEKAVECWLQAPDTVERMGNLALALRNNRQFEDAGRIYKRGNLTPKQEMDYGHFLLSLERSEGWTHLEKRFECFEPSIQLLKRFGEVEVVDERKATTPHRKINDRRPRPYDDLNDRDLLLWLEQAPGDQLQFLRYLPIVKQRWPRCRITVACGWSLLSLLKGRIGCEVVPNYEAKVKDYWLPSMSLPLFLQDFDIPEPFPLNFHERDDLPGDVKVGLCWQGNYAHSEDHWRSCHVEKFRPLADLPITLVNLQHDQQVDWMLNPPIKDFLDLARVVNDCDVVISVDSAPVHLAGCLGKPTLLMLSWKPDWRWGIEGTTTKWYPGTHTLLRQARMNDWTSVIAEVEEKLKEINDKPST